MGTALLRGEIAVFVFDIREEDLVRERISLVLKVLNIKGL